MPRVPSVLLLSHLLFLLAACGDERLVDRPPAPPVTDRLPQERASRIDILFVIDNSDSMIEEQEALGDNFARFLRYIDPDPARSGEPNEVDYRIAVTTTDASRSGGRLIRARRPQAPYILRPGETYNPVTEMQAILDAIETGGAREQGFEAALLGLGRASELTDAEGPMFLREGAWLYVIVVSDEDDSSRGEVQYWYRRFETLKGVGNENTITFSAIAGPLPAGCGDEARPGVRYAQLASLTGGVLGSICTSDWGATLEELAISGIGLVKRFQLSHPPKDVASPIGIGVEDFLEVLVHYPCAYEDGDPHLTEPACAETERACDGDEGSVICVPYFGEKDGWSFDPRENAIVFDGAAVPGPGSTVEVKYYARDL